MSGTDSTTICVDLDLDLDLDLDPIYFSVLVTAFKDTILAECAGMIKSNETAKLLQMYKAGINLIYSFELNHPLIDQ